MTDPDHDRPEPPARTARLLGVAVAAAAAAALLLALATAPPATAETLPCSDCPSLFDSLRDDILAYVPGTFQRAFLVRVDEAETALALSILPPSPILPPNPIQPAACAASTILGSLVETANGLDAAGLLSTDGLTAIVTDVTTIDELAIPTEPCLPPSPI